MSENALARLIAKAYEAIARLLSGVTLPRADEVAQALEPVREALAVETMAAVGQSLAGISPPAASLAGSLSLIDPDITAAAQAQAAHLVTAVSDDLRALIADVTERAVRGELTWASAAKELQQHVGLTPRWAKAVENTRASTYARLLKTGVKPLKAKAQADKVADAQRARLIKVRCETIARTEIMTAQNSGRLIGWQRAQADGLIGTDMRKRWVVAPEGTKGGPCPICRPLGKEAPVPIDSPFSNGRMMPPAHPRCRCTAVLTRRA